MIAARFVHLNVHSTYSLLEGLPGIKALAKKAKELNMPAVALTDTNNLFGAVEMSKHPWDQGVQPILGLTLGLKREDRQEGRAAPAPDAIGLLAQNEQGWLNLMQLSSKAFLETDDAEPPQVTLETLATYNEGLIALTGSALQGRLARLVREQGKAAGAEYLTWLKGVFKDRLYLELQRHNLPEELEVEADLVDLAYELDVPLVATNECRFLNRDQYRAFDALMCIGQGVTLAEKRKRNFSEEHYFKSADEMVALFDDLPEATANTVLIAQRCAYRVPMGKNYMPVWEPENDPRTVPEIMADEARKGLEWRLNDFVFTPEMDDAAKAEKRKIYEDRLAFELGVINRMGFDGYFLIVSDFCRWSKDNGISVGPGRGSGAGSLVAWSLQITNVDPIRYDLLFERFLNPDRVSLPDFDIDFCQERREEVINYVCRKYGTDRVAQIITFGSLKARACIRDVGRVLQLPFGQVSRIAAFIPEGPKAIPIPQALEEDERLKELYDTDETVQELLNIAMQLEGAYRHCSTHAAGVIISGRTITDICPLYKDPRSALLATQFSMGDAEAAGLVKFDFLGLKTLTVIQKSLDNIKLTTGKTIDIDHVPLDDKPSYDLLSTGHTVGVFQVEGSGMQQLMREAKPSRFEDLVALIALYRPGPMENIPSFNARKHGKENIESIHPSFDGYLTETYGIIVYQEQVMQCAQAFAGYTLGGADLLRRAMGKKKPEEMAKQREIFVKGAVEKNGVTEAFANQVFDTIDKFAGYGFNKSHALAYAVVSYHTLWLKTHYPKEFLAASMTLDKGNTDKVFKFKQELDRMGIPLLAPDVNTSQVDFMVEGDGVRFALAAIKGAGEDAMKGVVAERTRNGPYKDVFDFMGRMDPKTMNKRQLEALVKAGAFDLMEPNRNLLLSNADLLLGYMQTVAEEKSSNQIGLFGGGDSNTSAMQKPALRDVRTFDPLEQLANEQQALGFYLSAHPLDAYKEELAAYGTLAQMVDVESRAMAGDKTVSVAGIVLAKREMRTKSGRRMAFMTVSDTSGQHEAAMFPEAYDSYYALLDDTGPFTFTLNMDLQNETLRLSIEGMRHLEALTENGKPLRIQVGEVATVDHIKTMLAEQTQGKTPCHLVLPVDGVGQVVIDLGVTLEARRQLRLKLETLPGVQVQTAS